MHGTKIVRHAETSHQFTGQRYKTNMIFFHTTLLDFFFFFNYCRFLFLIAVTVYSTCILRRADAVAVTLLVHRSSCARRGESPVSGQGVWGGGGVWSVQGPLAGIAAPCCSRPGFGSASGSGICSRANRTGCWQTFTANPIFKCHQCSPLKQHCW